MSKKNSNKLALSCRATLTSNVHCFFISELKRRKEDTFVFNGRSTEGFDEVYNNEIHEEALEFGIYAPKTSGLDTFSEAVEGLVKELEVNKPNEISIMLASALIANDIDQEASLSRMYQVWYQKCNKLFADKYGTNTQPEPPAAPALRLAA